MTYTIEELEALPDARLNETAAELRGWHQEPIGDSYSWLLAETVIMPCYRWSPATDRNQSGELLEWLVEQPIYRANYTIKLGCGKLFAGVRVEWIDGNNNFQDVQVNGTSARSETAAFCAAMLAQQGRLKQ